MNSIFDLEDNYQLKTFAKTPVAIVKGKGCEVFDHEGTRYLDLYGGHCVTLLGHCHDSIVDAIHKQAQKLIFYSNSVYNDVRGEACQKLVEYAGDPFKKVFLVNSGTEANEAALRLAFLITGKKVAVSLEGDFHGRTAASNALTGNSKTVRPFPALPFKTRFLPNNNIEMIDEVVREDTAAVLIEPVQSIAGVIPVSKGFGEKLSERCREVGALLISDEVQCGFGRLGEKFGWIKTGITPDMITCAKGIAGGFPAGALLVTDPVAGHVKLGDLGCTFGGGPLADAAIAATLDALSDGNLMSKTDELEQMVRAKCIVGPVKAVRGYGLLLGLECSADAKAVQKFLFEKRILVGTSHDPRIVRLLPPLVLEKKHVQELADALAQWKEL